MGELAGPAHGLEQSPAMPRAQRSSHERATETGSRGDDRISVLASGPEVVEHGLEKRTGRLGDMPQVGDIAVNAVARLLPALPQRIRDQGCGRMCYGCKLDAVLDNKVPKALVGRQPDGVAGRSQADPESHIRLYIAA